MAIIMLRHTIRGIAQLRLDHDLHKAIFTSFYKHFDTTPNMASVLRFAWHDAGTYDQASGSGGPDGSLRFDKELAHAANTGLKPIRDFFEAKKAEFPTVNWPDLIQAGAGAAILYCKGPILLSWFGRKEAQSDAECPPEGRLPDASKGAAHLREVFGRMGFTEDAEIVALSGAHTLGRANKHKEGDYEGPWTSNPTVFDNEYYINLLVKNPTLLRLPTDKALVKDPEFRQWVEHYAKNVTEFRLDYMMAHIKLSTLGYEIVTKDEP